MSGNFSLIAQGCPFNIINVAQVQHTNNDRGWKME